MAGKEIFVESRKVSYVALEGGRRYLYRLHTS